MSRHIHVENKDPDVRVVIQELNRHSSLFMGIIFKQVKF